VAELAAARKSAKYTNLDTHYTFQPVAIEMLCRNNDSAGDFLSNLGHRFLFDRAMIEKLALCFSEFLLWFSGSVQFYYVTAFPRRTT